MERDEARELVREALADIAPEAELDEVDPGADLAEELDLDSMDVLELHDVLQQLSGIEITEADRPSLVTLDKLLSHLGGDLGAGEAR